VAIEHAVELASHFNAELCVLHVVPFSPVAAPDLLAVTTVESDSERMASAQQRLEAIASERVPAGVRVRCEVKMGYADKEITAAADEEGADMLVIATHGITGWRHMVFGSVAEAIVRAAHCPVLTVHSRPTNTPATA